MSRGQIAMVNLVTWGVSMAIAIGGTYWSQVKATEEKVNQVTTAIEEKNAKILERVARLEEAVITIKEDNKTMRSDVKEILRILR